MTTETEKPDACPDDEALDKAVEIFKTAMQQSRDDIRFSIFQAIAAWSARKPKEPA